MAKSQEPKRRRRVDGEASRTRILDAATEIASERGYEGTSIGLALVRKVVERMCGRVGVKSQPDQGSRFWVELLPGYPR